MLVTHKQFKRTNKTFCERDISKLYKYEAVSYAWRNKETGEIIVTCQHCLMFAPKLDKPIKPRKKKQVEVKTEKPTPCTPEYKITIEEVKALIKRGYNKDKFAAYIARYNK